MKRVLVTGCSGPASINFCKSLREAPDKYFLVGTDCNSLRMPLAQTHKTYVVPHANDDNYIDELNKVIVKEKVDFVHPQPDVEVRVIGEHRKELEAKTFLPSQEAIDICQDKYFSFVAWKTAGVQVPATATVNGLYRVFEMLEKWKKPYWPLWVRDREGAGGRGATIAYDIGTLIHWIKYWNHLNGGGHEEQYIVQEYLPGANLAWHSVWRDGELITSMARERLEYIYPYIAPSGITGTPAVQKTVHNDDVNRVASKAVLAVDKHYSGVACVDLKEDCHGNVVPTEINAGRFFTTSYFFTCAGLNLPWVYLNVAEHKHLDGLSKFNALPSGLMWIRHIDAPAVLVRDGEVVSGMYIA